MSTAPADVPRSIEAARWTAAQVRVLDAAHALFAEHGVGGTSLQMIADALGYTKAAVYRQFQAKDDIVIAVTERQLARLVPALTVAELNRNSRQARDYLLDAMIDLAVAERQQVGAFQFDPAIVRLLSDHAPFQEFVTRLYAVLIGEAGIEAQIQHAMVTGAIAAAVSHPLAAQLDDEALRQILRRQARRAHQHAGNSGR